MTITLDHQFEPHRRRMMSVAYRMLGRWSEAEDIVQDAYLRWQAANQNAIREPAAWLTTVVTRLCLDRIRRNKAARECYVGPWLPEPVVTMEGGERRDEDHHDFADELSFGLLLILERLSPEERAAFILREAFDTPYSQIANSLGKSEPAVRQLVSRAKAHVQAERPRRPAPPELHQKLLAEFLSAVAANDTTGLVAVMSSDIRFISDGGGKKPAALRVMTSPEEVAKLVLHLAQAKSGLRALKHLTLNSTPSLWFLDGQGTETVAQFEVDDGKIKTIYVIRNPDKLAHLNLN